ncbi:hypothetical protein EJB05_31222, partial [Eragrostis curvula]
MAVTSGMAFSVRPPAPAPAVRPCACAAAAAGGARARARGADGSGGKWWAPLLGWSGQPDYIDARPSAVPAEDEERRGAPARRFGVLTEDKARQLRMRMMETESFHDAMYHSAIASRLASATPDGGNH